MKSTSICPVCSNTLIYTFSPWHLFCKNCKYEGSTFNSSINAENIHEKIDEVDRERALEYLRKNNFKKLLDEIKKIKSSGSLLEIGSAHGWFLQMASKQFLVSGIEPDKHFYESSLKLNLDVRFGFFPEILNENEKFDIVIFNDVLEHIPDLTSVLNSCYNHLKKDGLLIINLPNSNGLVYKLSKFLFLFGIHGFFERLWQKDLPSPHLHYFNLYNLQFLLEENKFKVIRSGKLSSLNTKGLWERISYTRDYSSYKKAVLFFFIITLIPIIKVFPSDIVYIISTNNP